MSTALRRFIEVAFLNSCKHTFARSLGIKNAKFISNLDIPETLSFEYTVPKGICRTGETGTYLPTSSTLAVFDELSTYLFFLNDRTCRPGVSIHLATEMISKISPEQTVLMHFKADKIGKTVGFCTMECWSLNGELCARGSHIKYLPMGLAWDLMFNPNVQPATMYVHDLLLQGRLGKQISKKMESLFLKNKIEKYDSNLESGVGSIFEELRVQRGHFDPCTFELKVQPHLNNPLGLFHGGAIAMSIEESLNKHRDNQRTDGVNCVGKSFVSGLEIRYLSAMQGQLSITCKDDENKKLSRKSEGEIKNKRQILCAKYLATWM